MDFMQKPIVLISLVLISMNPLTALSEWARTYGLRHPQYPEALYLTGFAMVQQAGGNTGRPGGEGVRDTEALSRAKEAALTDLVQRIMVHIRSQIIVREKSFSQGGSASFTEVDTETVTTTDMGVAGIDYVIETEKKNLYVLAFIKRSHLLEFYLQKGKESLAKLQKIEEELDRRGSDLTRLYDAAIRGLPFIGAIEKRASHYRTVGRRKDYYSRLGIGESAFDALKEKIKGALEKTGGTEAGNFEEALEKIAVALKSQGVEGTPSISPPLTYGESMLSSEFGVYAAQALRERLVSFLPRKRGELRIKGVYWEELPKVRLNIIALEDGKIAGMAAVTFPATALKGRFNLEPRGYDQAVAALREFSEEAITDGGINVEVWSQKGRAGENLVFEEEEEFQLYLRVNQPAFLRITYRLATGEYVLLEPSYYIGIDRVARAVKFPFLFEVVPPLGVEQLVVTAYSQEPGEALTEITMIGGEEYHVYKGMGAVVARNRGLKKKQRAGQTDERVGEAMMSITTLGKVPQ